MSMFGSKSSEKVVELHDVPQSCIGAPCPMMLASDMDLVIAFLGEMNDPSWDGSNPRSLDEDSEALVIVATFLSPTVHVLGPPNDEAFAGHRLAAHGLRPYGAFEILNSKWIGELEKQNSVHPSHSKARYLAGKRHFVLTFHESVFECVAHGYQISQSRQSVRRAIADRLKSSNIELQVTAKDCAARHDGHTRRSGALHK